MDTAIEDSPQWQAPSLQQQAANGDIVAAVNGSLGFSRTVSDLLFHYCDIHEHSHQQATFMRPAGLVLGVVLKGQLAFALDGEEALIDASEQPQCFAFNLATTTQWTRITQEHNQLIKLIVAVPHSWITERYTRTRDLGELFDRLLRSHKVVWQTPALDKSQHQCKKACLDVQQPLADLEVEGIALNLAATILQDLSPALSSNEAPTVPKREINSTAYRLYEHLESQVIPAATPSQPDLQHIANELGMSVSTAQRCFKEWFGQTIIEFVRNRRLDIAREQLLKHKTIGEVAYQAGYKHTSNFALAFKKRFGVSPGALGKA